MKSLYIILATMKIVTKSLKYSSIICTVNSHYETREINCYFLKNKILTVKWTSIFLIKISVVKMTIYTSKWKKKDSK